MTDLTDFLTEVGAQLKITNIIGLATSTAAMMVIFAAWFLTYKSLPPGVINPDTTIAFLGGTAGTMVIYLVCQAAVAGAYANATSNLSGVSISAGATAPATPSTQTAQSSVTGANLNAVGAAIAALTPAQIQAMSSSQLAAIIAAALA